MSTHNYLFVSDLHLSEGRDPETGRLSPNEDFFHDDAFARFLVYHANLSRLPESAPYYRQPWKLVINGDFFDFLQVTKLPAEGDELEAVRGVRYYRDLSSNEREYGLGTRSAEIVWKLEQIGRGHPVFFQALGWFLAHPEYELIILKGNHDVEVHWPAVQARMRALVAAAYANWRAAYEQGERHDAFLPWHEGLHDSLMDVVSTHVQFPVWFYYEPGLFFVEHGNQYDPPNAFTNFLAPLLPEKPDLIELPAGSFFVRYFFNQVEQVHPFADNIKPIARYIRWALDEAPVDTLQMVIRQRRTIFRSLLSLLQKKADPVQGTPGDLKHAISAKEGGSLPLHRERWQQLMGIRDSMHEAASRVGNNTTRATVGSLSLNVTFAAAALAALRAFTHGEWRTLGWSLLGASGSFVGKTLLTQQLNKFDSLVSLRHVAEQICEAFNKPDSEAHVAAVPYYVFGHDHHAWLQELTRFAGAQPPFRQWYVNTGAWLPSFSDSERLTRSDVQLTFFRLIPNKPGGSGQTPELLEWLHTADRPQPVRLL